MIDRDLRKSKESKVVKNPIGIGDLYLTSQPANQEDR